MLPSSEMLEIIQSFFGVLFLAPPDSTPASKGPSTAVAAFPRWRAACQGQLPRPRGGRRGLQSGAPGAAAHTVAGGAAAGGHTVAGATTAAVGAAPAGGRAQGRVEVTLFSFFFCKWVFFCWTLCQDFSFFPKCTPGLFFCLPLHRCDFCWYRIVCVLQNDCEVSRHPFPHPFHLSGGANFGVFLFGAFCVEEFLAR